MGLCNGREPFLSPLSIEKVEIILKLWSNFFASFLSYTLFPMDGWCATLVIMLGGYEKFVWQTARKHVKQKLKYLKRS